jgi:hypothetical protein
MQRDQQNKLMDEMFSPISGQILPASIEERLEMYSKRNDLEDEGKEYRITKQKFLNYRQFNFKLISGKREIVDAYALSYSTLPRKKAQGRIEFEYDGVHHFNREEIKFITLENFNRWTDSSYASIKELIYKPLNFEEELVLRLKITQSNYDLTPIIVVDEIPQTKLSIYLDAKTYEDTKEKLIIFS